METGSNNLQEPLLQNEVAVEGDDWRTALPQEERERIANEMLETLKRNIPLLRQEDLQSFKKIAVRFEETIYTEATSQSDYLRRVSLKMTKMNAISTTRMANSLHSNAASNSENAQDPASQSMQSQIQDQVQQLPTAMVSDQSQVQSQNIQDNIASTGVPNSAGSAPSGPSVDGKSQGTMPSVPVQNPKAQNKSNETPSAVRYRMMLGRSTNSMFGFGQQQVVPQSNTQSHIQQQILMQQQLPRLANTLPNAIVSDQSQVQQQQNMNLLQLNQLAMIQQMMQQNQLGLQQGANTLPGDTQQGIQLTAPMLQPQTTIDQKKQMSQSQGNMPGFNLTSQSVQSQIQDQIQQLPTAMVSNQSQVQSQNIQDNIASNEVPNSADSLPAMPLVDGKPRGTMPSVPVQNLNAQNMSNETPFAVRCPTMQGRSTNSMFGFGQQQVVPQSITQSHSQQQILMQQQPLGLQRLANTLPNAIMSVQSQVQQQQGMNLLQLNQAKIQQMMQQNQLGLQQEANTLPGDTQQKIPAPMLQPQTTIDQKKQLSQSQGNMPGFNLTSQSMQPQIQDQVQQLPTAMVSNQSQVQSQNIQDNIASTEVPNSADSLPAMSVVDGKSRGTMPSVPVQNLNAQNMSNETPFAVRCSTMQQFITQSHIQQQEKMRQLVNTLPKAMVLNQSQMQQQQKMNLLGPIRPTLQQVVQPTPLRLGQRANTLPGATQQRIQLTAPTLQQQTTIDQMKRLSQSQGNMPDFKLGTNLDLGKKAASAIKKRHRSPVSSLQRGQLTQSMLAMQQSQEEQPQIPPNKDQMDSQMQQINVQGPTMPTQPNNLTGLQHNNLSSGSDVSNSSQNMLGGGLHPGSNVDPGQGNVLNQTQEVARNSMLQNPVGGSQQMNSSVSSKNGLQSNSNVVQPQQGNALNETQEVAVGGSQQINSSVSSKNGLPALQSNSNVVQPQQGNALNETHEVAVNPLQQNPVGGSVSSQNGPTALQSNSNVVPPQQIQMLSAQLLHQHQQQQQMNSSVSSHNGLSALQSNLNVVQPQQGNALHEAQEVAVNSLQQNPVGGSVSSQNGPTALQSNSNVVSPQQIQMLSAQLLHQRQLQQQMLEQYMVRLSMQQEQFQQQLLQHQQWLQTFQKQSAQQSTQQQPQLQQQEQTSRKQSAQQPIQQQQARTSQKQSEQQMPETVHIALSVMTLVLVFVMLLIAWKL